MTANATVEGAETLTTGVGDPEKESEKVGDDEVQAEVEHVPEEHKMDGENVPEELKMEGEKSEGENVPEELKMEGVHVEGENISEEYKTEGVHPEGENVPGEYKIEGEPAEGEHMEGEQMAESEHAEGEYLEGEQIESDHVESEHVEGEHVVGERFMEGEQMEGEHMKGEELEGEELEDEEKEEPAPLEEEKVEEEQPFVDIPVDPTAPYDFTDSKELLREPFELRQDQLMEVEVLWEMFQNYTPAYTDLDNYITQKELVFMLKALLILPYTPEQLVELINFCVRPPHPEGHINFEQFVRMVTVRQRDFVIEEELRAAFTVYDTGRKGFVDREELRLVLGTEGRKMQPKQLDNFMKEVDLSNDGTIGIEDAVGTLCIDLNSEDIQMLKDTLNPPLEEPEDLDF